MAASQTSGRIPKIGICMYVCMYVCVYIYIYIYILHISYIILVVGYNICPEHPNYIVGCTDNPTIHPDNIY